VSRKVPKRQLTMRLPICVLAILCALTPLSTAPLAWAQDAPAPPPAPPAPAEPPPPTEQEPPAGDEGPPAEEAPPVEEAPPAEVGGEAEMEGEGEDPLRPPPKGKGAVWGEVTDTKLNEPVIEAQVTVLGTKFKTLTDIDGRYRLELPPGTYNLRVYYEGHQPVRIDGVKVAAGRVVKFDATLTPEEGAVEVMEVETEADRAALEGQILARQRSASVGDGIGRKEISKTPDSNAAQAAQRVVGANIVGGRFVYVRGLGERYSNALLNGAPLPSPEPDRAAVPLDLFPAQALEGITINKTFTPHMPADFAGGSLAIDTRKIPTELLLNISISGGFNTQSTFRDYLSHRGSNTDWLGFDSGTRSKPDGLPDYLLARNAPRPDGRTVTPEQIDLVGRAINSNMSTKTTNAPPNHGFGIVAGNGWRLGPNSRVGALAALTYSRSFEMIEDGLIREFALGQTAPFTEYAAQQGSDLVRWGALGSVSYEPHPDHRLTLLGFHSQLSDKITNLWSGTTGGPDEPNRGRRASRLTFVARSLDLAQLTGEHTFKELESAQLTWNGSLGFANRDEPDTRDTVYVHEPANGRLKYLGSDNASGRHFWSEQGERSISGGLNWTQPLKEATHETKVAFGGLLSFKRREFEARRFNFSDDPQDQNPAKLCDGDTLTGACVDKLFLGRNIGNLLELNDSTRNTDAYEAALDVYGAYIEADVGLARDLRLIVGERLERTVQTVDPVNQFVVGDFVANKSADLRSTDLLPALGLVYSATSKAKLRASFTRTLARPQVRELAPFSYTDYFNGREYSGEPGLTLTKIWNGDLRFEYFPTLKEVAAFSIFYKRFNDPIEPVIISPNIGTYRNADSANLIGVEFETRKTLDFMAQQLEDFTAIFNLTLATSRIQVTEQGELAVTNASRALVQQAPYVVNLALDYTSDGGTGVRVLYNVVGRRIVEVGIGGLEDIYEHPRHMVDISASQDFLEHYQVKVTARNILNSDVRQTQGKDNADERLTRRFSTGAVYTLTLAYNF
jgi:hypothetical protein